MMMETLRHTPPVMGKATSVAYMLDSKPIDLP